MVGSHIQNFPVGFSTEKNIAIFPYSRLGKLIVLFFHNRYHCDVYSTVCFTLKKVYVVKARRIASSIDGICRVFKMKRKHASHQIMGLLPKFRTCILPAFSSCSLDLWGPCFVKDEVVSRGAKRLKKVWGLLMCCPSSRAIHGDLISDASTDALLLGLRRALALRGDIRLIVSDAATAMEGVNEGAYAAMKQWRAGWNEAQLRAFGAEKGISWKFVMPEGQHQNGAAESLIKAIKKSLNTATSGRLASDQTETLIKNT